MSARTKTSAMCARPGQLPWLLCLLALSTLALPTQRAHAEAKLRPYLVQPGDTCWSIAESLLGGGDEVRVIHRHNELGPMPHLLIPGQTLMLPTRLAEPVARINWLQRDVQARAPQAYSWASAARDMPLWRLHKVATGADSSAGIRFEDRSRMNMRENALLVIYASSAAKERARADRAAAGRELVLERGTLRGGLARLDAEAGRDAAAPDAAISVRTPSGRVSLRSQDTQIEVDELKSSIISVFDGIAEVAAQGVKVVVAKSYGTVVKRGRRPERPRRLPETPRWRAGDGEAVVLAPGGAPVVWSARWHGVPGASRYRLELVRDDEVYTMIADVVMGAGVERFEARALEPGAYIVRVSAIDASKLQSVPSAPKRLRVVRLDSSRPLTKSPKGPWQTAGLLRLTLDPSKAEAIELAVNDGSFRPGGEAIRLAATGAIDLQARISGSTDTSTLPLEILGFKARLEHPPELRPGDRGDVSKDAADQGSGARLQIQDELGRAVVPQGLSVTAEPGGALPLAALSPGEWSLELPVVEDREVKVVDLQVSWAGGSLASAQIPVVHPPILPFRWALHPVALSWPRAGLGRPARSARPQSSLGLGGSIARQPKLSGDPALFLRGALRANLALLDGVIGLDAELPWIASELGTDPVGRDERGDARIGTTWAALRGRAWTLSPGVSVAVPGGDDAFDERWRVEPSLVLEWRPSPSWTIATSQIVSLALGDSDGSSGDASTLSSTLDAGFWMHPRLSLGAQLWSHAALASEVADGWLLGSGAALRWHLGRLRIGLEGGASINETARDQLGTFLLSGTIDLGFRGL